MSICRALGLSAVLLLMTLASCSLAANQCHAMSDCDDGTTCVEGLCTGGETPPVPIKALSSSADASAARPGDASDAPQIDAAAKDATTDAGQGIDASDAALTDAAPDA